VISPEFRGTTLNMQLIKRWPISNLGVRNFADSMVLHMGGARSLFTSV